MVSPPKSAAALRRAQSASASDSAKAAEDEGSWALLDEAGLSKEVGFVMRMAQLALFDDLLARLSGLKLTLSQLTALRLIQARPGLTQQRIGDALRVKKTNLVALIDKLEGRGLVSRMSSATDRRAYALHLTARGERVVDKAMEAIDAHMKVVATLLDQDEQDRVVKSLRKLAVRLPHTMRHGDDD